MIEIGEYIRTIDGYIRKVTSVNKKGTYEALCYGAYSVDMKYKNSVGISAKKIKAHSKNIIDLIEVGDIVNGSKVSTILYGKKEGVEHIINFELENGQAYLKKEKFGEKMVDMKLLIETILTKEQYEQNSFKL